MLGRLIHGDGFSRRRSVRLPSRFAARRSVLARLGGSLRAVATYDFFPEFSAKVRRLLYNPLGVLALAALAAARVRSVPARAGLRAGRRRDGRRSCSGVAWPWLSLRGLRGSIAFEQVAGLRGRPGARSCLTLRNRLPWSAWGWPCATASTEDPDDERRTCSRRQHRLGAGPANGPLPLGLRAGLPGRLPAAGAPPGHRLSVRPVGEHPPLVVERPLLVWPRTFPVGPVPLVGGEQQVEGNVSRNKVGSNGDVLGVRPYRRGDSPRRIHWGQSARHDRLIVCELQSNARPVIQLVLDADPRVHAGDGPDGSREWAIRIVASLAKGWLEAGAQVGAVWDGQVIPPASGQRQLHRLLDGLARLPDDTGTVAGRRRWPGRRCRGFRDGLQVIVTTDLALARSRAAAAHRPTSGAGSVLRAAGFGECRDAASGPPVGLPGRPWLWIDSAEHDPGAAARRLEGGAAWLLNCPALVRQVDVRPAGAGRRRRPRSPRGRAVRSRPAWAWRPSGSGWPRSLGWFVPAPARRSTGRHRCCVFLHPAGARRSLPFVVEPLRRQLDRRRLSARIANGLRPAQPRAGAGRLRRLAALPAAGVRGQPVPDAVRRVPDRSPGGAGPARRCTAPPAASG